MNQHCIHIFVGSALQQSALDFHRYLEENTTAECKPYYTVLRLEPQAEQLTLTEVGGDEGCTTLHRASFAKEVEAFVAQTFRRHVNVTTPGTGSLTFFLYQELYDTDGSAAVRELLAQMQTSSQKIEMEVVGLAGDMYTLFHEPGNDAVDYAHWRNLEQQNLAQLATLGKRMDKLVSVKMLTDTNATGVSLNLNQASWVRMIGEMGLLSLFVYRQTHSQTARLQEERVDAFGLAVLNFDRKYFVNYLTGKAVISTLENIGVEVPKVSVNVVESYTDPLLKQILKEIGDFYDRYVQPEVSNHKDVIQITAAITPPLNQLFESIKQRLLGVLSDATRSQSEKEAILAMVLGLDSRLFTDASVTEMQLSVDDLIHTSLDTFIDEDRFSTDQANKIAAEEEKNEHYDRQLPDNPLPDIKKLRTIIRNATFDLRKNEDHLAQLRQSIDEEVISRKRLTENGFEFHGVIYRLDPFDPNVRPLDEYYEPKPVNRKSVDLRQGFSSIKSQGQQGACAAFASAAVAEYMIRRLYDTTVDLSEAFLYYNARKECGETQVDRGVVVADLIRAAAVYGICLEKYHPYRDTDFTTPPTEEALADGRSRLVKKGKQVHLKVDDFRSAINEGYPIAISSRIFDSFSNNAAGFIPRPSKEEENQESYHAMVICGYSDEHKIFVVRNSWGTDFGDQGYCYMSYAYAEQYIRAACIITEFEMSESIEANTDPNGQSATIVNFNTADAQIAAGILTNYIEEEKDLIRENQSAYAGKRGTFFQLLTQLGNPNIRNVIASTAIAREEFVIKELREREQEARNRKDDRLSAFKTKWRTWGLWGLLFLVILGLVMYFWKTTVSNVTQALILVAILVVGYLFYRVRLQFLRHECDEDIQQVAEWRGRHEAALPSKKIRLQQAGMIIDRWTQLNDEMKSVYQRLVSFNGNLQVWLSEQRKQVEEMHPEVKEPILDIITNEALDQFFAKQREEITSKIDLLQLFDKYELTEESIAQTRERMREVIKEALSAYIADFRMIDYVISADTTRYPYLPKPQTIAQLIPKLCHRATPFLCPCYTEPSNAEMELRAFLSVDNLHDRSDWEMRTQSAFDRKPATVEIPSSDKIVLMSVKHYSLEEVYGGR